MTQVTPGLFDDPTPACAKCGRRPGADGRCWCTPPMVIPEKVRAWHGDLGRDEVRARLSPQCHEMLALLRAQDRVSNVELAGVSLKYTGRISDLRQAGYNVRCVARDRKTGLSWYSLKSPVASA